MKRRDLYAYAGKILRVDLNSRSFSSEATATYAEEWLGGSGIAQWILYNELKPWMGPYDPSTRLIFSAGPLVGTLAPGGSRMSADSKNPLTMGVGSSNADSFFGQELKFAGYDHIIFQGKSRNPVYLWIDDDHLEIRDASALWGMTTWETSDAIRTELGDEEICIISIGPAGENLVREACIIENKGRAMGRCGLGGVMGSKNLKAVAVRGTNSVDVAEPERFMDIVFRLREMFKRSNTSRTFEKYGTPGVLTSKQKACSVSYKNFQELVLPEELYKKLDVDDLNTRYKVRHLGYPACPQPCHRYFRIDHGPYAGFESEGFQFEAMANFCGKLAVWDPTFQIKMNAYCNQLGLGVDLPAGAIAWAMECYQRGILKQSDADGLKLEWGDAGVILELTRKIAYREGFGAILAEGSAKAAEILGKGSEYYAMHIKGQDLYEVIRSSIGWGLGACVSTRGGGHVTGSPGCEVAIGQDKQKALEIFGITTAFEPILFEGKVKMVEYFERFHRACNSLGICHFCTTWMDVLLPGFPELAELYSAATGWQTSEEDLRRATTRILNVEKAFNLLHTNFDRTDDYPPPRDLTEPIPSGPFAGFRLTKQSWDKLLDEYYEMNHWDTTNSFPTRKCLEDLGLNRIADDLERVGKLGNVDTPDP
jgi:aldehyde:ferredoxin oxidoreductase